MTDPTTPLTRAYQAYEEFEGRLATALEHLVATNGFADLFATTATNAMALTRMANGTVDRLVRTTRLAARRDVTDLARQLARTEDKLEQLLQAVETLQQEQRQPQHQHQSELEPAPRPALPGRAPAKVRT